MTLRGDDSPFWEPGEEEKLVVVCPPCLHCGQADQVAIDYGPAADDCLPEYREYLQKKTGYPDLAVDLG